MKKIINILIICVVLILGIAIVYLKVNSKDVVRASEEEVIKYANEFIESRVSAVGAATDAWKEGTEIEEKREIYDVNDNIDAYVINLKNKNDECGYILIKLLDDGTVNVPEYGYDGKHYLCSNEFSNDIKRDKIVCAGGGYYFKQEDGTYINVHGLMEGDRTKLTKKQIIK